MNYWTQRSSKYNQLKWVKDKVLLNKLLDFCCLSMRDKVLDLGCGTGVVANSLIAKCARVTAIDKSQDMISQGYFNKHILRYVMDFEKESIKYLYDIPYDKIISRMVLHHIAKRNKFFNNVYKALEKNGWFIIEEGGIFYEKDKKVKNWYNDMMSLKEKRHTFTVGELQDYFKKNKFKNIKKEVYINGNFSINDWLINSGQSKRLQKQIYAIHYNAPNFVKDYYNMKIKDGEIFIDSKVLLIKGQK